MRVAVRAYELPSDKADAYRRAARLEWWSIAYLVSAIALLFAVLGSSQAMKAAWIEDILSLAPPIAFLVAARVRKRPPDAEHPWGHQRAVSIAYLFAALALLVLGSYVLLDSVMKLFAAERPPIGTFPIAGIDPWAGWVMLGALAYTGIPPVLIGRRKLALARELHDKVLYADAEMNRADWMTAGAAAAGVLGIGLGLWWADAVAGAVISLDIVRDGWRNVRAASGDLMDVRARTYDSSEPHPLTERLEGVVEALDWVEDAEVRLRDHGHVLVGEVLVVPRPGTDDLLERCAAARHRLLHEDWQLHELVVAPVLPEDAGAAADDERADAAPAGWSLVRG